jgi:hypothetical protein
MRDHVPHVVVLLGLAALFAGAPAAADTATAPVPPAVTAARAQQEALRANLARQMRPAVRPKVEAAGRALVFDLAVQQHAEHAARSGPKPAPLDLLAAARARVSEAKYFGVENAQTTDVDALVQIVLLEAAHDADRDLEAALAAMRAANKAKTFERDKVASLRDDKELLKEDYDRIVALKDRKDALGELAEELALRIQLALERRTKFYEILSNIAKARDDLAKSVVKNMKG